MSEVTRKVFDHKRSVSRRKVCRFCADPELAPDYKNVAVLRGFVGERGKILPRRITGNCAKHQRRVDTAVKRARMLALVPFAVTGE